MAEDCKCTKDAEIATLKSEVKTLFKTTEETDKRVRENESTKEIIANLDKNMAVQTKMLEHIVDHNIKQDIRADKQEKRADKQEARADKQDQVMLQMSTSLTKLNEEVKGVKSEVEVVKKVQSDNESKHTVDLRDISKKQYTDFLIKYSLPIGGGAVLIWQVIQIWKG